MTPTLTATLSPPGILEIGPELLLTPLENPSWIRRSARKEAGALVLLSSALKILRLRLLHFIRSTLDSVEGDSLSLDERFILSDRFDAASIHFIFLKQFVRIVYQMADLSL